MVRENEIIYPALSMFDGKLSLLSEDKMDNSHVGLWLLILLIIVQTIYLAEACNNYFF